MYDKDKIAVSSAELHTPCRISGLSETSLNQSKMPGAQFYWTPNCLLVKFKKQAALVPHANVKFAIIEGTKEKEPTKQ